MRQDRKQYAWRCSSSDQLSDKLVGHEAYAWWQHCCLGWRLCCTTVLAKPCTWCLGMMFKQLVQGCNCFWVLSVQVPVSFSSSRCICIADACSTSSRVCANSSSTDILLGMPHSGCTKGVNDGLVEPFMLVLSESCQTVTLLFLRLVCKRRVAL
jgi:hypothetical protein